MPPYARGLAVAALAALVAGCTSGSGAEGSATDSKAGPGTQPAAQPGKYRTLLEPCGSVGGSTLKDLLPGVGELPDEQQQKALRGTAASTYDTDRRVGCRWQADSPDATHTLSLDFERVVSYDPAVSDVARTQDVFAKKQIGALPNIPPEETAPPAGKPSGSASTPAGTPTGTSTGPPSADSTDGSTDGSTAPGATAPGGTDGPDGTDGTAEGTPDGLAPRLLDSLGDAAFLNDVLSDAGTGSTAQRRTVSVVFRTSNVMVTVLYTEQSARTTEIPDSRELQEKAQSLARNLVEKFSD
ncbi:DUF3558 domain-containing protein [Streptomyces sp. NPDC055078]